MANPIPLPAQRRADVEIPTAPTVSNKQHPSVLSMEDRRAAGRLAPEDEITELNERIKELTIQNERLTEKVASLEEQIVTRKKLEATVREARGKLPIAKTRIMAGGAGTFEIGDVIPDKIAEQLNEGEHYVRGIVNV